MSIIVMENSGLNLGVVSRCFPELTCAEAADLIAANGFTCTELCFRHADADYWTYNGRGDLSALTDSRSRKLIKPFRDNGIEISSLGVFTNLIATDETELASNLAYFTRMMEIAAHNCIPVVATECGFTPGKRGINPDTLERDFSLLAKNLEYLATKAGEFDLSLALEPCIIDIVPSAKRTADLLAQIDSARLRVLLDPANLIANNTESEMFAHLTPHISYFHGKDRKLNDVYGRAVGDGDIDWPLFFDLYRRHTPGKPFILEYVTADNFAAIGQRTRAFYPERNFSKNLNCAADHKML